jgi:hypothetical protein
MKNVRLQAFLANPKFILTLILVVFFLKGVFLATLSPIFDGQDEARHYDTIQYFAEPKNAVSDAEKNTRKNDNALWDKDNFDTYNFSEEIQKTATATNTNIIRGEIFNTIIFANSFDGQNEAAINSKTWKPYNYYTQPDIASSNSLYHRVASDMEKLFAGQNILVRFYLIRIFSVLLGTLAVLFCYLTAKTIGFSAKHSLLLAAILSFQPKFSMYLMNINYDVLLIPMFFLFTFSGVLALKKGLNWKSLALLVGSTAVAIMTKPTGYMLAVIFVALITYLLYEKVKLQNKRFRYGVYGICFFTFLFVAFYLYSHFLVTNNSLGKTMGSIGTYISQTITFGKFVMPSSTYWGNLSWTNSWILNNATDFIFILETTALVGLGLLLFSKKPYPNFLPAKKYVVFLIGMIVALQLGIRTADWHVFSQIGGMKMSLGTPGRYFLPNLGAHIILVFTGLGALFEWIFSAIGGSATDGRKYFDYSLIIGLILMFAFMLYLIFDTIILRFYL